MYIPTKAKVLLILFLDLDVTGKGKPAPLRPNSNINVTYITIRRTFAVCSGLCIKIAYHDQKRKFLKTVNPKD